MTKSKTIFVLMIFTSLILLVGCESTIFTINRMDSDIAEKLPDDQRDIVLDEALAEIRSKRIVIQSADGYSISRDTARFVSDALPEQSKNIPIFEFTEEVYVQIFDAIDKYFKALGLPTIDYVNIWNCIDPRLNAIYDDEDKGVAAGYDNENILLWEYLSDNEYRFLVFVRESENAPWQLIHLNSAT